PDLEFTVSADDGVRIDGKIHRKLPDCRQLVAGRQPPRRHRRQHLIHDLAVDRYARAQIELKRKVGSVRFSHLEYDCTILLEHVKAFFKEIQHSPPLADGRVLTSYNERIES